MGERASERESASGEQTQSIGEILREPESGGRRPVIVVVAVLVVGGWWLMAVVAVVVVVGLRG